MTSPASRHAAARKRRRSRAEDVFLVLATVAIALTLVLIVLRGGLWVAQQVYADVTTEAPVSP